MRYAIVSDIHANWQAWSAVRDDIQKRGVDTMVCLGDIVGYGPSPTRVFADLVAHCDNFVLGNHDAAAAGGLDWSTFNDSARRSAEWTASQFDRASLKKLGEAPLVLESEDILFVHAETPAPADFGYVETHDDARACFEATDKRFIFIGHTHKPLVYAMTPDGIVSLTTETLVQAEEGVRYLVNVGSVGDPGDGSELASYCIFDSEVGEISLRKVAFDVAGFRAELERVPELGTPWFLTRHEGETARPVRDQAVTTGKVAGSKIRVSPSHGKIRIKSSALATHAGETLRVANEAAKTSAKPSPKKPKRSNTGLIVASICVVTLGALAGIYFYSNKSAPAQMVGATGTASVPQAAPAAAMPGAPSPVVLPSFQAVASSEETGNGKANLALMAIDGDPATRWCSGDKLAGHWLQIELGKEMRLGGVNIAWEIPELVYGYKIEGSSNARRWTVLAEGSGKSTDRIALTAVCTFVRITVTSLPDAKWASISEVKFFDAGGLEIKSAPPSMAVVEAPVKRGRLVVVSATYGVPGDSTRTRDVRGKLQAIIDGGATQFTVSELAQGDDPAHGVIKTLMAECTLGDQRITLSGQDQQRISLPVGQPDRNAPAVQQTTAAGGAAESYTSLDSLGRIPEAKDYQLVYDLDLGKLGSSIRYNVDNSANAPRFDRVAYLVELKKANEVAQFVWVSMDAFTSDARKLGIPTVESGVTFQQSVENITVVSDAPGLTTGERLGPGNMEFWSQNYSEPNSAKVPGADSSAYDFGDSPSGGTGGYGSMQVHNTGAKQTIFAINAWARGAAADLGIGNCDVRNRRKISRDWTFSSNAGQYTAKRLRVFVRPTP